MVTYMNRSETSIDPDEIRAIRVRLGLSQVEAGEVLGGGPRAFTKYESGTITPRASVVRLLRVLDANPAALASLKDGESPPAPTTAVLPFEVTSEHIERLTAETFPQLLRRLLSAEAQANRLPPTRYPRCGKHHHGGRWRGRGGSNGTRVPRTLHSCSLGSPNSS